MEKFIDYDGIVMIPVQSAGIKFFEKEEVSLNSFQNFLLEAIEQGSSIPQIVEATLLTCSVIETEIMQMIRQKFLVKENGSIMLSDLSKKILMVSRCVKELNNENKKVCINLITGDIEEYDPGKIMRRKEGEEIYLAPKISQQDIDGISVEENMSFFGFYMDTFHELDAKQAEIVLESVYIEFDIAGKNRGYKSCAISRLPCLMHTNNRNEVSGSQGDDMIGAKGQFYKICYSVNSKIVDEYKDIIPILSQVGDMDIEMLSEKGRNIIKKYEEYTGYSRKNLVCYFDSVSGKFQFEQLSILEENRRKANMDLPIFHVLSSDVKEVILEELKEYFAIPYDLDVYETNCFQKEYMVEFSLRNLWGDEDDKEKICSPISGYAAY